MHQKVKVLLDRLLCVSIGVLQQGTRVSCTKPADRSVGHGMLFQKILRTSAHFPPFDAFTSLLTLHVQFMDIPDLDAEEDMSRQVAAAPAVRSVSVMDIAELESEDLFRLPVVAKDHAVDLTLLTACLCPADEVSKLDAFLILHVCSCYHCV